MKLSTVLASTAMMAGSMVSAELDPIVMKVRSSLNSLSTTRN